MLSTPKDHQLPNLEEIFQNYTWLWVKPWRNYKLREYWSHWIQSQYHIPCLEATTLMLIANIIREEATQLTSVFTYGMIFKIWLINKWLLHLHQQVILTLFEFYFTSFFRLTLWSYWLFRIHFLVGLLLNKINVLCDAFGLSCYSYVNQKKKKKKEFSKIEKIEKLKKKNIFQLGALGLQVISIHFKKLD